VAEAAPPRRGTRGLSAVLGRSARVRRLALGGDAGHRVGAVLRLVLPLGMGVGNAERLRLGRVGRHAARDLLAHDRGPYPPPAGHRLAEVAATVTFLTDYGQEDEFVGVCHAVIARIAPEARVIDLTHGIARHDVRTGAIVLRRALPYCPPGVHLAVVDPGVGGMRRAVALRTAEEGRLLVGPDNGLLSLAAQRFGGAVEAVDVAHSPFRLEPVSATFHGRDLFAPVAAQLAAGAELATAGEPLDTDDLVQLHMPMARLQDGAVVAHAIAIDVFGNVTLDVEHPEIAGFGLRLGRPVSINGHAAHYTTTFADVPPGELLLYQDAYRALALAVNRGSAADLLGIARDDELRIAPQ
jgi:S-adenosyl-L-methionine hydrolase (adenosine-forming)